MKAHFEEKTYEVAYLLELRSTPGPRRVFSPGQVLEGILGFDAAADPSARHVLWSVLRQPRPRGVQLLPEYWKATGVGDSPAAMTSLPTAPISLILQFKRPDYLASPNAKQWFMWNRPYYRFERRTHQQQVLRRLEARLGGAALVTYASPSFHTMGEFEVAQDRDQVIPLSGHVAPSRLQRHRVWTYIRPGSHGRGNPDGSKHLFETLDQLLARPTGQRSGQELSPIDRQAVLLEHLAVVAAACREREPTLRTQVDNWVEELSWTQDLPPLALAGLRDYVSIQSLMHREQASWLITEPA